MAVLALGFVGEAIGASIGGTLLGISAATIGGFIGSAIGSMVDNLLFPQKQQGPRLTDLHVQVSTYGKVIPLAFGPENRIAGNVIWSTGLLETAHTHSAGKGVPSVKVTEYTYRVSCAVLLCEGVIRGVRKIWANSKLIFDADATSEGAPGATGEGVHGGFVGILAQFFQAPGETHATFDSLQVYPGDFTQTPDPTIESYLGAGEVPAYRGSAYIVLKDLQLADFGNRIPNLEFLVVADDEVTVGGIAREIIERCGIDPNTASTSNLDDQVSGFVIGSNSSGTGALQPLALAFNFDAAEVGGGLRLFRRGSAPAATIPFVHLAGHQASEDRPEAISWTRAPETTLPREAAITFIDPDRDWQVNTQTARRQAGSADNNLSTELALTMSADKGREIADRSLWEAWTSRQVATTATDDRWISIEPGRTYVFETAAGLEPLRVTRRTRGANGVIEMDLRRDRAEVYESRAPGAAAAVMPNELSLPGVSELILLDIPLLTDADDNAGFYFGVVSSGTGWRGADVLRALNLSEDFDEVAPVGFELTVGDVSGTLGDGTTTGFDDVNVITVTLRRSDMTLESVTDDALAANKNACFIGDPNDTTQGEILQFGIALQTAPGVYQLSHLVRGRKGTEFATSLHGPGEEFVLLEPGALQRANFGVSDLGEERAFKAVSLLTQEADADAVLFTDTGVGLRPYSPVDLVVHGVTGDDLELDWTRRSRLTTGELAEATELYRLRIMNGVVVVREVDVIEPTFTYTAAMQTADFGGPVSDLTWRVAQVSATYGAGIFAEKSGPVPTST